MIITSLNTPPEKDAFIVGKARVILESLNSITPEIVNPIDIVS